MLFYFWFFIIRLFLYEFPQLFSFRQFQLFNPTIYAANSFNSSLGDLLINSIFITWVILFSWYNIGPVQKLPPFLTGRRLYIAGIVAIFFLIFSTFQLANIVKSLVADSKISFNVTDFFGLDIFTVIGLIVLALLSLSYYYFTRLLFRFIFPNFQSDFFRKIYGNPMDINFFIKCSCTLWPRFFSDDWIISLCSLDEL